MFTSNGYSNGYKREPSNGYKRTSLTVVTLYSRELWIGEDDGDSVDGSYSDHDCGGDDSDDGGGDDGD